MVVGALSGILPRCRWVNVLAWWWMSGSMVGSVELSYFGLCSRCQICWFSKYCVIRTWEALMFLLYGRHWWSFMLYKRWWHYTTFVVVVRTYVHVFKHCTIVAPGCSAVRCGGIMLWIVWINVCWTSYSALLNYFCLIMAMGLDTHSCMLVNHLCSEAFMHNFPDFSWIIFL